MRSKGFTLIELLAVIVILAIIALIASPIVINIVKEARISAAERSTEAVILAAKQSYMVSQMDDSKTPIEEAKDLDVDNPPSAGTIAYDPSGDGVNITATGLIFGGYTCTYTKAEGATCTTTP